MTPWLGLLVIVALLTAAGHLLFKKTALKGKSFLRKLVDPVFLLGGLLFASAPVLTFLAARHLDFSIIFSATALNFIFVMVFSRIFLGEPIDRPKIAGLVGITAGLVIYVM